MELLNVIELLPFNKIFCKHFLNERCSCTGQKKGLISKDLFMGLNEQHAFTEGSFACKFMLLCIHNYVQSRSAVLTHTQPLPIILVKSTMVKSTSTNNVGRD